MTQSWPQIVVIQLQYWLLYTTAEDKNELSAASTTGLWEFGKFVKSNAVKSQSNSMPNHGHNVPRQCYIFAWYSCSFNSQKTWSMRCQCNLCAFLWCNFTSKFPHLPVSVYFTTRNDAILHQVFGNSPHESWVSQDYAITMSLSFIYVSLCWNRQGLSPSKNGFLIWFFVYKSSTFIAAFCSLQEE